MQGNRGGWLGWLLFVFIIFGSQLVPPIARVLSQITGQPISSAMVFGGLVGIYILIAVIQAVVGGINNMNRDNQPRMPTNTTVPSRPTQAPPQRRPPTSMSVPTAPQEARYRSSTRSGGTPGAPTIRAANSSMPPVGPPRFEPIIDPRILVFGIIGLIFFGGFFLLVLVVSGTL